MSEAFRTLPLATFFLGNELRMEQLPVVPVPGSHSTEKEHLPLSSISWRTSSLPNFGVSETLRPDLLLRPITTA
jgi:hypothetical protein